MTAASKPTPSLDKIQNWLSGVYAQPVQDLAPLDGGFWSSAYSYGVVDDQYVLRLSELSDSFKIDQMAMRFARADLPVPEVYECGESLNLNYAISQRCHGTFLEDQPESIAGELGKTLGRLLAALRSVPATPDQSVVWYAENDAQNKSWHQWLRAGLTDSREGQSPGYRATIAQDPDLNRLFESCTSRIESLLPLCPERRDLIHGDLLHQNVLVNPDASRINAVFSWKCSAFGDFLYDVAWCTLWSAWFPTIAQSNIWERTLNAADLSGDDLENAAERHHCFELQIAAIHLGWYVRTQDAENLTRLANVTNQLLTRGPLPA